jgi:pimeloyl-ACP methyl ester carboxylesterase
VKFVFAVCLALVLCFAATAGAADARPGKGTFILVHGAFFDASGFAQLSAALERRGYRAMAIDLPGRGAKPADPHAVTLRMYRDAVLDAVHASKSPVWLVGHSFGGIVVSEAAEAEPDGIAGLIYLAALLPRSGESLTALLPQDTRTTMGPGDFLPDPASGVATIARGQRLRLFCADCPADLRGAFADRLVPEPLRPLSGQVALTARFSRVPKAYLYTRNDAILSYAFQQTMVQRTPVRETATLDTGHAPFLSDPDRLADALVSLTD